MLTTRAARPSARSGWPTSSQTDERSHCTRFGCAITDLCRHRHRREPHLGGEGARKSRIHCHVPHMGAENISAAVRAGALQVAIDFGAVLPDRMSCGYKRAFALSLSQGNGRGSNFVWGCAAAGRNRWDSGPGPGADQPGIVTVPLVEDAPGHQLAGDEPAGRLANADERVVTVPEHGIDRGHRMDAVAGQQVPLRADRPVFRHPALKDSLHRERTLVHHLVDPERPPHRDVFAIAVDGFESRVQIEIHARLGEQAPGPDVERLRQPTDRVQRHRVVARIRTLPDGPDERRPGVRVLQQLRLRLRAEDHHVIEFIAFRRARGHHEREAEERDDSPLGPSVHRCLHDIRSSGRCIALIMPPRPRAVPRGADRRKRLCGADGLLRVSRLNRRLWDDESRSRRTREHRPPFSAVRTTEIFGSRIVTLPSPIVITSLVGFHRNDKNSADPILVGIFSGPGDRACFLSEFPECPVCFDSVKVYPRSVRSAGIPQFLVIHEIRHRR